MHRKRRQQLLREAEGYLDLVGACGEHFELSDAVRHQLSKRALVVLSSIKPTRGLRVQTAYLRGLALRNLEQYRDAVTCLSEAAEIDGENTHIWLALGWCHKRMGRLDLAIESLERAMEVDSGQSIVYYNLACYWSLASNTKLALAYLTRAFDLEPSFRDLVDGEADFDPIRSDPRFLELTSVIV
jgi:tetratricopeptide (TPR) repeat protein